MTTSPREAATRRVHQYAVAAGLFAGLPLPITSEGLAMLETRLLASIARTYSAPLSSRETVALGVGVALVGRGLKRLARGAANRVPAPFGLLVRMAIAAGTVEAFGHALILAYEAKR